MIVKKYSNQFEFTKSVSNQEISKCRKLLLLVVIYRPSAEDLQRLLTSLSVLSSEVGYALVVNDYFKSPNIEKLKASADFCLLNTENLGYGRAINQLVEKIDEMPEFLAILNQDLSWNLGTFEKLTSWMDCHPDISLAVPRIENRKGKMETLCKRNPTILALFSRRFVPQLLKPIWLKQYDKWYEMLDFDYSKVFECEYLSGCCMLVRSEKFCRVGGFDQDYFLYLEDADFTRKISAIGRCVHLPIATVVHGWGRGNHRNFLLTIVNLVSAWIYFRKWGFVFW